MKPENAPTGTRVRHRLYKDIFGVVVRKDDIDKYSDPNKPRVWGGDDAVVRVDDDSWHISWQNYHKPFFRWAVSSDWEIWEVPEDDHIPPVKANSSDFCGCDSPDLITNTACGNKFQYCRRCKKERL